MRILVTGVGGDIGQSIVKCLHDSYPDAIIHGCDIDEYAAGRAMVVKFTVAPRATREKKYLAFMLQLVKDSAIDIIIPAPEIEISLLVQHREQFAAIKVSIAAVHPSILSVFLDKYQTVIFMKAVGVLTPTTTLLSSSNMVLNEYPVIIKERSTHGSKGVVVARDDREFIYHRDMAHDAIVQEIVGSIDEEYTMGVFSDGETVRSICFRRYLGYGSLSKYVELCTDPATHLIAKKVARHSDLVGSINIQMRKTREGYAVFEVNPRLSSTVYFRHCFGFTDVKWLVDMMQGLPLEEYTPKYRAGIGVRTVGETFFGMEESE